MPAKARTFRIRAAHATDVTTSNAIPISPYSVITLVYAHMVHTLSAFDPVAKLIAASPFIPLLFSNCSALAAPACMALMMLPAP